LYYLVSLVTSGNSQSNLALDLSTKEIALIVTTTPDEIQFRRDQRDPDLVEMDKPLGHGG